MEASEGDWQAVADEATAAEVGLPVDKGDAHVGRAAVAEVGLPVDNGDARIGPAAAAEVGLPSPGIPYLNFTISSNLAMAEAINIDRMGAEGNQLEHEHDRESMPMPAIDPPSIKPSIALEKNKRESKPGSSIKPSIALEQNKRESKHRPPNKPSIVLKLNECEAKPLSPIKPSIALE
jgi:hypothetical protein